MGSWGRQGSSSCSTTEFLCDPSGVVYSLHASAVALWVVQRRNTLKLGWIWIQEYPRVLGLAYLYVQKTFRDNKSESINALILTANSELSIHRGYDKGTQEQQWFPSPNYVALELRRRSFLTNPTLGVFCERLQLPIKLMSRNMPVCCVLSDLERLEVAAE